MPAVRNTKSPATARDKSRHLSKTFFVVKIDDRDIKLRPTVVFDTFWRVAVERHAMTERRREGLPQPWTKDPILKGLHFCNVFRVADRASQYLIREVIEKGSQEPIDIVFRVVLFNLFTKTETYELLDENLGPLTWATYDQAAYEDVLSAAKDEGMTLYTGAFQKPAPKLSNHREAFRNHLRLLEALMNANLTEHLLNAKYMADVYTFIAEFPGMAEFTSYQLLLNLSYTPVLNFSDMDFVIGGPGARSGLTKCFGSSITLPTMEAGVMHWMAETQDEHFARLGLTFSGLGPDRSGMSITDIEHTLCEVDKYSRVAHPQIRSLWGPMRKRVCGAQPHGSFKPSPKPYPPLCLPAAWSHPDRKIVRIKPGPLPRINKRYVVNKILKKRVIQGKVQYFVDWWGYSREDATWEPAENLMDEIPSVITEYEAGLQSGLKGMESDQD